MPTIKRMILGMLIFLTLAPVQAATVYNIPFQNVILNPNATIQGNYTFGNYPIIFCYENNLRSVGIFKWTYQKQTYTSTLSVPIVTNKNFGEWLADSSGKITIQNNQSFALLISCVYGF